MLKYLIIQLDDSSASFCHYPKKDCKNRLIPLPALEEAFIWAMKENLIVQLLYPDYILPEAYKNLIDRYSNTAIVPASCRDTYLMDNAPVVVFDSISELGQLALRSDQICIVRTAFEALFSGQNAIFDIIPTVGRINIVITDIQNLNDETIPRYKSFLDSLSAKVAAEYTENHTIQINLLTDRLMLSQMNNCNAGHESICVCPDGNFYLCPAFYGEGKACGNPRSGYEIRNRQLLRLSHSPICRRCDAWHCKRCIWLNQKLTLEVNTPGRQQCVAAHTEREASRMLLKKIPLFFPAAKIPELGYLDPFETLTLPQA